MPAFKKDAPKGPTNDVVGTPTSPSHSLDGRVDVLKFAFVGASTSSWHSRMCDIQFVTGRYRALVGEAMKMKDRARQAYTSAQLLRTECKDLIAKAQADTDTIDAEEEGDEKVSSILDNARFFALRNTWSVEESRAEFQRKLEELEALTTSHRRELEAMTHLARRLAHDVSGPNHRNDSGLEIQESDSSEYSKSRKIKARRGNERRK